MTYLNSKEELLVVDIDTVIVNPYQPRRFFNQEEIEELAESIQAVGLLHPPLVRFLSESKQYEIISGERRYRALCLLKLKTISVLVRHTDPSTSAQAALVENMQRVDLNPLEISKALHNIMREFALNQDELSRKVGKKRSTVANYLRILSLPIHIQDAISKEKISMGHAKAILGLQGNDKQNLLYELILRDNLNVRETEAASARIGEKSKKNTLSYIPRDFYLEQLAEKIQHKLGTKVAINGQGKKGRITIDYYSLDDLDRLLDFFDIRE